MTDFVQGDEWPPKLPKDDSLKNLDGDDSPCSRPTTVGDNSRPVTREGGMTVDSMSRPSTRGEPMSRGGSRPNTGKRRGQADQLAILGLTVGSELQECQQFIAKTFFDEKHYNCLYNAFHETQHENEALAAAANLMEAHGATLSRAEIAKLQNLDEAEMVEALVSKMPMKTSDDFETFFHQLQMFVSLATRIRQGLDDGDPVEIESALQDAHDSEAQGYISKMALLRSAAEAQRLKKFYNDWVKEMDDRLGKLLSSREDLIAAQKRQKALTAIFTTKSMVFKTKATKVLTSIALCEDSATLKLLLRAWREVVIDEREAGKIRAKYAAQVQAAKQRLQDVKMKQIENVKGVLLRRAAGDDKNLLSVSIQAFQSNVADNKRDREVEKLAAQMGRKLKHYQRTQAKTAQSVLGRMNASSEGGLRSSCFKVWLQTVIDEKTQREKAASLDTVKQQMERFKQEKKEKAQVVLDSMSSASDAGLQKELFNEWSKAYTDAKFQRETERQFQEAKDRYHCMSKKLRKLASDTIDHTVGRSFATDDFMTLREVICAWRNDAKLERIMRKHEARIASQKTQLTGVQAMFRDFASQLENNMSQNTPRGPNSSQPKITRRPSGERVLPPRPDSRGKRS